MLALGLLLSCSSGPSISGGTASASGKGKPASSGDDDDDLTTSKDGKKATGGDDVTLATVGGDAAAEVQYPTFKFNGRGNSICGSMNHVTTINVTTTYSASTIEIKKENSHVYCEKSISGSDGVPDSKCNDIANSAQSLDKRNQTTIYTRLQGDELAEAKKNGLDYEGYAIFSKEIKMGDGRTLSLSEPLPISILPAGASRYENMTSKTWHATANNGSASFEVQVTISKVSGDDHTAVLKIDSVLPAATSDWTPYENWPMPAEASYTIDEDALNITSIMTTSRQGKGGQDRCSNQDHSTTTLTLCDRVQSDKTKNFGCVFGPQHP